MRKENGRARQTGRRMVIARRVTLAAVLVAVLVSLAFDSGLGTPSSFGIGEFFLLCPLGGIEAMIASRAFIPVAAISAGIVLLFSLLFGRAWCAWGCPAPAIRRFFKREPKREAQTALAAVDAWERPAEAGEVSTDNLAGDPSQGFASSCTAVGARELAAAGADALATGNADPALAHGCQACGAVSSVWSLRASLRYIGRNPRTWTLVAVIVATLIAGLPLFCLICPIGLTFGTVGSLWHLIVDKQMTASVLVFPLALVVELVAYRKWCLNLCPIAGLLGIVGQFAVLFRPRVSKKTCLRADGSMCHACAAACPEHIDLHAPDAVQQLGECTRCGACAAACPTASIAFHK